MLLFLGGHRVNAQTFLASRGWISTERYLGVEGDHKQHFASASAFSNQLSVSLLQGCIPESRENRERN